VWFDTDKPELTTVSERFYVSEGWLRPSCRPASPRGHSLSTPLSSTNTGRWSESVSQRSGGHRPASITSTPRANRALAAAQVESRGRRVRRCGLRL